MRNRVWIFLAILVFGSAAAFSAFAHPANGEFYAANDGDEGISNDQATKDREDVVEATETCENDCVKIETDLCSNTNYDPTSHIVLNECLKKVPELCERKCN